MGYAEIACCAKCEVPVETNDQFRHTCNRCNSIWLNDDLLWLDWKTAKLNIDVLREFDLSAKLMDNALDLINAIKNTTEKDTTK